MRLRDGSLALVLAISASGCPKSGGDGDGEGSPTPTPTETPTPTPTPLLRATVAGATRLAIQRGYTSFGAAPPTLLVAIDSAGNVTPVLSESRETWAVFLTSSNVIATGDYYDVYDPEGNEFDCWLIAASRTSAAEPVRCLSQNRVGTVDPSMPINHFYDQPGVAVQGESVYFTLYETPAAKSELWRWDGSSDVTERLIQLSAADGNRFVKPLASQANGNVCAVAPAGNGDLGKIICGDPAVPNFSIMSTGADGILPEALQVGEKIFNERYVIDAEALTSTFVGVYQWAPTLRANRFSLLDGSIVGVANQALRRYEADGAFTTIDASFTWSRVIGGTDCAVALGSGGLRRIDLTAFTVGTADLLSGTNLLQVNELSYTLDERVRIDGVLSNGDPGVLYVDTVTGEVVTVPSDLAGFQEIVTIAN